MPTDAEIAAALDLGRRLDREAELGWPEGYDAKAVAAQVRSVLGVLEAALAAAPPEGRELLGREFVATLNAPAPAFTATVAPRKRRAHAQRG